MRLNTYFVHFKNPINIVSSIKAHSLEEAKEFIESDYLYFDFRWEIEKIIECKNELMKKG